MNDILVHDVGLRDGLQMESRTVPTPRKLQWLGRLVDAGIDMVQVGSFVNPQKLPQMADTDEIFQQLTALKRRSTSGAAGEAKLPLFTALVLNDKGLDRGMACGVDSFCTGVSASDTHSLKNTGMTTAEATQHVLAMGRRVLEAGRSLQVSVQSAFGCGYEGAVPHRRVLELVERFADAGFMTLSLADTAGHADPGSVEDLFGAIRQAVPEARLACHFHDTYGLGMANVYAALRAGVTRFESAFGGLGGCPFTAIAAGNICTEDLVHLLHRLDLRHDIRCEPLADLARDAAAFFDRTLPGHVHRTGMIAYPPRFDSVVAEGSAR